ncbi:putative FAD dependent oxidoreductase [Lyophyllum shimeji]|uniref:FAD dependent oxidoreductase n=1 Tax=Lyophyllum shimeji TaxID=47721 RepID=A0A9P3PTG5_LYOSH|nr:putative FAD dependent oxidoreductase [Lyophyllum shimeji]
MSTLATQVLQFDTAQAVLELPTSGKGPAGLPVPNSTRSFWIDTPGANPLAKEGSEGDLAPDADVCIIGSGITGVSAAYHLAKNFQGRKDAEAPIKAVILEARDFCSGATGRNGGHLTPAMFQGFSRRQQAYGAEEAKKLYALEQYTTTELIKIIETENLQSSVDFVASDHICLLVTEEEVREAHGDFAAAQSAGVDVGLIKWLTAEECEAVYGASYPAWRHPGHNVWPLKLVTHLYKLAQNLNPSKFQVNLHTNTPVTFISASTSKDHHWSLSTPRGDVQCSYVIHATNAYASHLLPHMHGPTGIIPTRGQVSAIRAAVPLSEMTSMSWEANQGFEYWFPRPINGSDHDTDDSPLVILGGGREAAGPDFETYVTDDSVVRRETGKVLRDFLPGMFPGKYEKGREPEMEWTGIMGYTALGDPFVGPVVNPKSSQPDEFKGQYISAGYTGHGMPRAYACAEVVAGMVAADMTGDTWRAPEWLPQHFLTTGRP